MIINSLESKIPTALKDLINVISSGSITYGLLIIAIAILMLLFSRYFKYLFFIGYVVLIFLFIGVMQNMQVKFQMIMIIALIIFMPFLYLGIKYSFSITTVNIMMLGYAMLLYPVFKSNLYDALYASAFIIIVFVLSILTFFLIIRLKLRSAYIRGEEA